MPIRPLRRVGQKVYWEFSSFGGLLRSVESGVMARSCEICGKQAVMGNTVQTRGKAKYLGGVGTKVTGISRRQFRPNLQRVRISTPTAPIADPRVHPMPTQRCRDEAGAGSRPFKLVKPAEK